MVCCRLSLLSLSLLAPCFRLVLDAKTILVMLKVKVEGWQMACPGYQDVEMSKRRLKQSLLWFSAAIFLN